LFEKVPPFGDIFFARTKITMNWVQNRQLAEKKAHKGGTVFWLRSSDGYSFTIEYPFAT
jgi:hypothetical protein